MQQQSNRVDERNLKKALSLVQPKPFPMMTPLSKQESPDETKRRKEIWKAQ